MAVHGRIPGHHASHTYTARGLSESDTWGERLRKPKWFPETLLPMQMMPSSVLTSCARFTSRYSIV